MSIYLGAGSTAHKMSKLYVGVGGQARQVKKMYVGVDGQARLVYQSGKPLGNKPVGEKVFFDVNNIRTEWIIVHQGLPGDMYDASCFGTWLLCNSTRFAGSYKSSGTGYANSDSQIYLEDTFFRMINADIKPLIKRVRIPYMGTESFPMEEDRKEGADGLATKVFPLSITELNGTLDSAYEEGAALSYFRTEATARRKWSRPYWTRTPTGKGWTPSQAAYVTADGAFKSISAKSSYSYRPALVLPQEVLVSDDGNVMG